MASNITGSSQELNAIWGGCSMHSVAVIGNARIVLADQKLLTNTKPHIWFIQWHLLLRHLGRQLTHNVM